MVDLSAFVSSTYQRILPVWEYLELALSVLATLFVVLRVSVRWYFEFREIKRDSPRFAVLIATCGFLLIIFVLVCTLAPAGSGYLTRRSADSRSSMQDLAEPPMFVVDESKNPFSGAKYRGTEPKITKAGRDQKQSTKKTARKQGERSPLPISTGEGSESHSQHNQKRKFHEKSERGAEARGVKRKGKRKELVEMYEGGLDTHNLNRVLDYLDLAEDDDKILPPYHPEYEEWKSCRAGSCQSDAASGDGGKTQEIETGESPEAVVNKSSRSKRAEESGGGEAMSSKSKASEQAKKRVVGVYENGIDTHEFHVYRWRE